MHSRNLSGLLCIKGFSSYPFVIIAAGQQSAAKYSSRTRSLHASKNSSRQTLSFSYILMPRPYNIPLPALFTRPSFVPSLKPSTLRIYSIIIVLNPYNTNTNPTVFTSTVHSVNHFALSLFCTFLCSCVIPASLVTPSFRNNCSHCNLS
jgi:hypothetical protein